MRGKIFLFLFALPFAAVGVFATWSIVSTLLQAHAMSQWDAVEATLSDGGYRTNRGDDSDTYKAYATYHYTVGNEVYQSKRVAIDDMSDNIGSFHQTLGRRLARARSAGEPITVYVDPANPASAVIDRSVRWGMVAFKGLFTILFGGVGFGLLFFGLFGKDKPARPTKTGLTDRPWLANAEWQTATILSDARNSAKASWIFAILWCLVSAPLPFLVVSEVTEKSNYAALIALLFPALGVLFIVMAVNAGKSWRTFGPAPLTLDPYPASIGGQAGGSIEIRAPFDRAVTFMATLTSVRSYESGSGEDRRRRENVLWQDMQLAETSGGGKGTMVRFRFDVPKGQMPSDADPESSDYVIWRLNIKSGGASVFDRDYLIPVYPTAKVSRALSDIVVQRQQEKQLESFAASIREKILISSEYGRRRLIYPWGRNKSLGGFALLFGAVFAAIGAGFIHFNASILFGSVFLFVGVPIMLSGFYLLTNSLEVVSHSGEISTVRRVLGIPLMRRTLRRLDFEKFEKTTSMKSSSGTKHTVWYSVNGIDRNGNRVRLGEGFEGKREADAAIRFLSSELGLREKRVHQHS